MVRSADALGPEGRRGPQQECETVFYRYDLQMVKSGKHDGHVRLERFLVLPSTTLTSI